MVEPIEWSALVESVGRFGLSDREAVLYLALVRRGRATARELTRDAQVDRVLGYRLLDGMRGRGIVEMTAERPRRYAPTPPSTLFERELRERKTALQRDERMAHALAEQLLALERPSPAGASRYQLLAGTPRIYDYLEEMVGRARRDVQVMVTHRALRESLEYGLQHRIAEYLRRKGRFRLILESEPRSRLLFERFERSLRAFPTAEFRQLAPQPARMTIVDGTEALLFLVAEAYDRRTEQVAVWTDNGPFVASQRLYFEKAWESAAPPSWRRRGARATPRDRRSRSSAGAGRGP